MVEAITNLAIVFVCASVGAMVFNRLKQPVIPSYILTGLAVGYVIPEESFITMSQLGVIFLIFMYGLQTELGRIKPYVKPAAVTGLVQVAVISTFLFVVASSLGWDIVNSVILAASGAVSSTLIGTEFISDEISMNLLSARLSETTQIFQDTLVMLLIAILSSYISSTTLTLGILASAACLIGAVLFRYRAFPVLARQAGSEEEIMLLSLTVLTGFVGFTELAGVSTVVGSFAAGIAVSKYPENLEIADTVGSIKEFFSAILFVSIGALVQVPTAKALLVAVLLIFMVLVVKPLITGFSLMSLGYDRRTSFISSINLDQMSEFALILVLQASLAGAVTNNLFQAVVLASAVTIPVSSYTSRHREIVYASLSDIMPFAVESDEVSRQDTYSVENHVILAGFDIQGKQMAETLDEMSQDFVVIENNPEKITELSNKGYKHVYGDAAHRKTWERANYKSARLIVSTVPVAPVSSAVLSLETDSDKFLRAKEVEQAKQYIRNGADYVESPDILASKDLNLHVERILEDEKYRDDLKEEMRSELERIMQT